MNNPIVYINAIGCVMALLVAPIARQQQTRGGKYLTAMLLGAAIWSAGAAMEHTSANIPFQIFWSKIQYLGVVSVPVFFLLYSIELSHLAHMLNRRHIILLSIIPLITLLLTFTNEYHNLIWTSYTPSDSPNNITIFGHGPWFWAGATGYSYLLLLSGTVLFIITARRMSVQQRAQVRLILIGTTLPWLFNAVYVLGISPVTGLELTPLSIVFSSMIFNLSMVEGLRLQVLESAASMEFLINDLREQITRREELEQNLLQAQEILALRLAEQSNQLAGLYDLLLVTDQETSLDDILQITMAKIINITRASLLIYFQPLQGNMVQMSAFAGAGLDLDDAGMPLQAGWLAVSKDVYVCPSTLLAAELPRQLVQGQNLAALFKWAVVKNHPHGILAAYWPGGHEFSVEEIAMFAAITDGLGLILQNARLQQSVASTATMQERRRLARDLHDSVTQSLNILAISAETAIFKKDEPQHLARILSRLEMSSKQALKEMRLLLFELRLAEPAASSLIELLTTRLDAVERHSGISAELNVLTGTSWPRELEPQLYMLTMEALNNALKHARASHVQISLSGVRKNFTLEIKDNGHGFDPQNVRPGGMGLRNMAERCASMGATLHIESSVQSGTLIRVTLQKEMRA